MSTQPAPPGGKGRQHTHTHTPVSTQPAPLRRTGRQHPGVTAQPGPAESSREESEQAEVPVGLAVSHSDHVAQEGGGVAVCTHHGLLLGRAGDGHSAARVHRLLGHLHVHLPVVFGDEAVVEIVVLDFQENGLPVYVVPAFQEVDGLGGDEHAVAVDVLHGDEAAK